MYAVDDAASFARAGHWVRELDRHADGRGGAEGRAGGGGGGGGGGAPTAPQQPPPQHRPMVVALIGNKADLPEGDRAVSTWEGQAAAAAAGLLFAETSAAEDGGTVEAAFLSIARAVAEADGY